jgi:hypothetical protein
MLAQPAQRDARNDAVGVVEKFRIEPGHPDHRVRINAEFAQRRHDLLRDAEMEVQLRRNCPGLRPGV